MSTSEESDRGMDTTFRKDSKEAYERKKSIIGINKTRSEERSYPSKNTLNSGGSGNARTLSPSSSDITPKEPTEITKSSSSISDHDDVWPVNIPAEVWVKKSQLSDDWPEEQDFRLKEETITGLRDGEIIVVALCFSVRLYQGKFDVPRDSTMIGEQLSVVVDSRHEDFPCGMRVVLGVGWRTVTCVNPRVTLVRPVPEEQLMGEIPPRLCLGILGLPGLMAYFGFFEICKPQPGDVVLINDAGSFIGLFVGQMANIVGCKVVAFVGSTKVRQFLNDYKFYSVSDYRYTHPSQAIARVAPDGVDIYFDCAGGHFTQKVLGNMTCSTRMCVCGDVKAYRKKLPDGYTQDPYRMVSMVAGNVSNHTVYDYYHRFGEAESKLVEWIQQGKIRYEHTEWHGGFSCLPAALRQLKETRDSSMGQVFVHTAPQPWFSDVVENGYRRRRSARKSEDNLDEMDETPGDTDVFEVCTEKTLDNVIKVKPSKVTFTSKVKL